MKNLLKNYFGYDKFRPMQEDIIKNILQKKDVIVIMSTGGGKSICYQLPALKFEGVTLVISPLIALMKDQVDELKSKGINAEFVNSSLSYDEITNIQDKIWKNEVKILYLAPERLVLDSFREFLKTIEISLIAIDEAHCISEWGHEFRPDYRNLKLLREIFPNVPIIALTATATKKVREDILNQLSLRNPQIFVSSFNRKNLNLIVMEKKESFNKLLKLLVKHYDDSVIIYCFSRRESEKIAKNLTNNGFNALPYHAGLDNEIRKHNQELFINNEVKIIVATIAFGMGINKPDVRMIVHYTFPKSVEGYYQEIGRAGRDGLPSDCVLFYSYGDKRKHEYFINQIKDQNVQKIAKEKLSKIINYSEMDECRRKYILEYFGEDFSEDKCNSCDICSGILELSEKPIKSKLKTDGTKEVDYDLVLFEKLRNLRKQIADRKGVSSFIIFSDKSLKEMSYYFPSNNEEFLKINGVGQQKLIDFGELFLKIINNHKKENNVVSKENTKDKIVEIILSIDTKKDYHKRLEKIKEKFSNAYEPWEEKDDNKLKELYSKNISVNEIAQILGRQPSAIKSRLRKLEILL